MLVLLASLLLAAAPCKPLPDAVTVKVHEKKCFKTPADVKSLQTGADPFDAEMTGSDTVMIEGVERGTSMLTMLLATNERLVVQITVK